MIRTMLVTDLNEVTNIKATCGECGYSVHMPCKIPNRHNVHNCPACGKRFPLSDTSVENFCWAFKTLTDNIKNDPNFKNIKLEIEIEEKKNSQHPF